MAKVRLSRRARLDIAQIERDSLLRFGSGARDRYRALIRQAIRDLADDPTGPNVRWREIGARRIGLYHIAVSRRRVPNPPGRVQNPRHLLVIEASAEGDLVLLGLHHDSMERRMALLKIMRRDVGA